MRTQLKRLVGRYGFGLVAVVLLAGATPEPPHARVSLLSEHAGFSAGSETQWLALQFEMDPGWHIYWKNPGDTGQAPRATWELPEGWPKASPGDWQWPAPEKLPSASPTIVNFGYSGKIQILVPFRVSASVLAAQVGKELTLRAKVKWLVCSNVCIPGRGEVVLKRTVLAGAPSFADGFQDARSRIPSLVSDVKLIQAPSSTHPQWIIKLPPYDFAPAARSGDLLFFPAEKDFAQNSIPPKWTVEPGEPGTILGEITRSQLSDGRLPASWGGVLSDGNHAIEFSLKVPGGGSGMGADFLTLIESLLFAFLGGLILNLMPCVFPVLSIKALSLIQEKPRVSHAVAYTLGILASFWILAGAILVLRAGGDSLGWGFQLQSTVFVGALALLFTLIGLNLLGIFEIAFAVPQSLTKTADLNGTIGSFFSGVLATVVATPCTAPFMGAALGFALSQPAWIALLIFTFLGLGLAGPYVALSVSPYFARRLPKPGRWMETLKQGLAFPIFLTVVWLVWVLTLQEGARATAVLLGSITAICFISWVGLRWRSIRVSRAVLLGILLVSVWGLHSLTQKPDSSWRAYSESEVKKAVALGKAVFVDFTAAWCVTCQVNEAVALNRTEVQDAFHKNEVVLFRGDWTQSDPEITRALAEYGRNGVPLYLFYSKRSQTAQVLPQILTPAIVLEAIQKSTN